MSQHKKERKVREHDSCGSYRENNRRQIRDARRQKRIIW